MHAFNLLPKNASTFPCSKRFDNILLTTMRRKQWQARLCGGLLAVFSVYLYLSFTKVCLKNISLSGDSKNYLDFTTSHQYLGQKGNIKPDFADKRSGQVVEKHIKLDSGNSEISDRDRLRGKNENLIEESKEGKSNSHTELSCKELKNLLEIAMLTNDSQLRHENDIGNRGIYFSKITDELGEEVSIILKVATLRTILPLDTHFYRYKTALKEIRTIKKLEKLNWKGVPKLYGACTSSLEIIYAVKRIHGKPLCKGFGTNISCVLTKELNAALGKTEDPFMSTMLFLSKVTCFFKQFERDKVFMEDLTGSNLYYEEKTFDIYVVDADSLIFYGDHAINSGASCKNDQSCPNMPGNFWEHPSLNRKIYSSCHEMKGNCDDYVCSGFDASLHACGIGRWLLSGVRKTVPKLCLPSYREVIKCMTLPMPKDRCTLATACDKLTAELIAYHESVQNPAEIDWKSLDFDQEAK